MTVALHQFDHRSATDRSVQPGARRDNLAPRLPTGIVLLTVAQDLDPYLITSEIEATLRSLG